MLMIFFFCLTPETSLKTLIYFGLISGYKINMAKSLIFPVNDKASVSDQTL